jgi:hypothetical protein
MDSGAGKGTGGGPGQPRAYDCRQSTLSAANGTEAGGYGEWSSRWTERQGGWASAKRIQIADIACWTRLAPNIVIRTGVV